MLKPLVLLPLAAILLSACSGVENTVKEVLNKPLEYKQSRDEEPLEIPPDLTKKTLRDTMAIPGGASGSTTYSAFNQQTAKNASRAGNAVLPANPKMRMERDGSRRWIVMQAEADAIWDGIRDFWLDNGFLLVVEDPDVGIMETEWAENRAEIPLDRIQGFLGSVLDNVYDAGARDKFRVRLERGSQPGTTEIYVTHQRAEEVVQGDTVKWEYRPRNPEVEVEMMSRMMIHMGVAQEVAAQRVARAAPVKRSNVALRRTDGSAHLVIADNFSRSWRIVGQALDQVGFTVEDRDRSRGVYYVRYKDPEVENAGEKGWLSRINIFASDEPAPVETFQVVVSADKAGTQVRVMNEQGQKETTGTGDRIIALIHEQLS